MNSRGKTMRAPWREAEFLGVSVLTLVFCLAGTPARPEDASRVTPSAEASPGIIGYVVSAWRHFFRCAAGSPAF